MHQGTEVRCMTPGKNNIQPSMKDSVASPFLREKNSNCIIMMFFQMERADPPAQHLLKKYLTLGQEALAQNQEIIGSQCHPLNQERFLRKQNHQQPNKMT